MVEVPTLWQQLTSCFILHHLSFETWAGGRPVLQDKASRTAWVQDRTREDVIRENQRRVDQLNELYREQ